VMVLAGFLAGASVTPVFGQRIPPSRQRKLPVAGRYVSLKSDARSKVRGRFRPRITTPPGSTPVGPGPVEIHRLSFFFADIRGTWRRVRDFRRRAEGGSIHSPAVRAAAQRVHHHETKGRIFAGPLRSRRIQPSAVCSRPAGGVVAQVKHCAGRLVAVGSEGDGFDGWIRAGKGLWGVYGRMRR